MSKISGAIREIHFADEMAQRDTWLNRIHSLAKLLTTICYLALVMSCSQTDLMVLFQMSLYPVILFMIGEIPFLKALYRLRFVLLAIGLLAIANPIFDRRTICYLGSVVITSGMVSMLTLFLKAAMAVFASYILLMTTGMENICYALELLHVPTMLVTLIMLIYRYLVMMLKETERVMEAYHLRAPYQRGIHYKAWGPLVGQMMLRSIDRAQLVYESMTLRGFSGRFYLNSKTKNKAVSIGYTLVLVIVLFCLRTMPVFVFVGQIAW